MYRLALVLPSVFLLAVAAVSQSSNSGQSAPTQSAPSYSAIPVEAAKTPNPVKSSPESLARAKKWWGLDCAMCHNTNGNGQGDTAKEMKLKLVDFTDPKTLKDRTDGEVYYIIKNGHNDMPAEGPRIKSEEGWDLVNYVRSLAKSSKDSTTEKPQ